MYIYDSAWGADNATSSHVERNPGTQGEDRKSTRLNSSHTVISYAVFCLKKKTMLCGLFLMDLSLPEHRFQPPNSWRPNTILIGRGTATLCTTYLAGLQLVKNYSKMTERL